MLPTANSQPESIPRQSDGCAESACLPLHRGLYFFFGIINTARFLFYNLAYNPTDPAAGRPIQRYLL